MLSRLLIAGLVVPVILVLMGLFIPLAVIWALPYFLSGGKGPKWYLASVDKLDRFITYVFESINL